MQNYQKAIRFNMVISKQSQEQLRIHIAVYRRSEIEDAHGIVSCARGVLDA